jgi:hypothetical protein
MHPKNATRDVHTNFKGGACMTRREAETVQHRRMYQLNNAASRGVPIK